MGRHSFRVVVFSIILCSTNAFAGQVVVDNTFGHAGALAGPAFSIGAGLGKQVGTNLFQSFSTFDLSKGDVATFSAPANVNNIVARVTGGSASSVDGTIASRLDTNPATPHPASFYLINPAGVIFGPDAALDVGGSFAVSTANFIRLADGTQFTASPSANPPLLTTAAPAAFGFSSATPAQIVVGNGTSGPSLTVPTGASLAIIGGPVTISGAKLAAPGGGINLAAVGSTGEVGIDGSQSGSASQLPTMAAITLLNTDVGTDGFGGGTGVLMHASDLSLTGSAVHANNFGAVLAGGINLTLSGALSLTASSSIRTDANESGAGGPIAINAASLSMVGNNLIATRAEASGTGGSLTIHTTGDIGLNALGTPTGVISGISSEIAGTADGGAISISCATLELQNGAFLDTSSFGSGRGGDLHVTAHSLQVLSDSSIRGGTFSSGNGGTISINVPSILIEGVADTADTTGINANSNSNASGRGGDIAITANTVQLLKGSAVLANSLGAGAGGNISISAATSLIMDQVGGGPKATAPTISTSALGGTGGGPAGNISVNAGLFSLRAGAEVDADVESSGHGGNITLNTGKLVLAGDGLTDPGTVFTVHSFLPSGKRGVFSVSDSTEISVAALSGNGEAGSIRVVTNALSITDDSELSTSSFDQSGGGSISIQAGSVTINPNGFPFATGITGASLAPLGRDSGRISLQASSLTIDGGIIASDTFGIGNGGSIAVRANRINVAGLGPDQFSGIVADTLSAQNGGAGGNVSLEGKHITIRKGAAVTANTVGSGNGGNVSIVAGSLVIAGDGVAASVSRGSGNAGTVQIQTAAGIAVRSGGVIETLSDSSSAGVITLDAGGRIVSNNGLITVQSKLNGGDLTLHTSSALLLRHSLVTAHSGTGGRIAIDAGVVALESTTIDGRSNGLPVLVGITSSALLESAQSQILTNSGITFPVSDIAGSLELLSAAFPDAGSQLVAQCGRRFSSQVSSFVVSGQGGEAPAPGTWFPDLDLQAPRTNSRGLTQ